MATTTTRNSRALRWLIGVLLAFVAAFALCEALGWPFLRAPLQRALANGLARDVRIDGEFAAHLLGGVRVRGQRLVVGPARDGPLLHDAAGRPRDFLDADGVALTLPYSTVWHFVRGQRDRPVVVDALVVDHLDLGLVRDAEGRANWHFGTTSPKRHAELPRFDRLVVKNGRLRYDDAVAHLDLDATLATHEGRAASEARLQAEARGHYRDKPVRALLTSAGLLPLVAPPAAGASAVPVTLSVQAGPTELSLDGRVHDVLHLSALDAAFHLVAPSLAAAGDSLGLTLPTTAPFRMDGRIAKAGEVWSATIAGLTLGSSRLRGDFRYDRGAAPARLSGTLGGSLLALPDLAPAFGKAAGAHAKGERVLPQRKFDIPSLAEMDADVGVKIDRFQLGTPQLEALAPLQARVRLHDGRLAVQDLVAGSSGGRVRGDFALDAGDRQRPRWSAELHWSGVQLDRFIKPRDTRRVDAQARAEEHAGRAPGYVSGLLSGEAKLSGRGRSAAELLGSLDGSTQMWVKDGEISHLLIEMSGIDVAESLGVLVRGDEPLPVRCAVARVVARDGVLTPEVAVIDTKDTTLLVSGKVDLGDEKLALLVTARPRDITPVALRGPLHIDGSFAHPQVHLDRAAIGWRVAAAAALATVAAPLASLLAFVDLGDADKAVCRDAVAQMKGAAPRAAAKSSERKAAQQDAADDERAAPRTQPPSTHRME